MDRPRWLRLPVLTFRGLQRTESHFRRVSRVERSSSQLIPLLHAELQELTESVQIGDRQEIMCEVADIAILLSEMANAERFPLGDAVRRKIRRNADKYPPRALKRLQDDWGLTPQEAMDFAKGKWDRSKDRRYFS